LTKCDFSFLCSKLWHELRETEDPSQRLCDQCSKPVFLVRNREEFAQVQAEGRCVAVRRAGELDSDNVAPLLLRFPDLTWPASDRGSPKLTP
jgi:hypothetical protein